MSQKSNSPKTVLTEAQKGEIRTGFLAHIAEKLAWRKADSGNEYLSLPEYNAEVGPFVGQCKASFYSIKPQSQDAEARIQRAKDSVAKLSPEEREALLSTL